jgi:hypothetical protein
VVGLHPEQENRRRFHDVRHSFRVYSYSKAVALPPFENNTKAIGSLTDGLLMSVGSNYAVFAVFFCAAHRAFCAAAIFARADLLIFRFFFGVGVDAVFVVTAARAGATALSNASSALIAASIRCRSALNSESIFAVSIVPPLGLTTN